MKITETKKLLEKYRIAFLILFVFDLLLLLVVAVLFMQLISNNIVFQAQKVIIHQNGTIIELCNVNFGYGISAHAVKLYNVDCSNQASSNFIPYGDYSDNYLNITFLGSYK